MIKISRENIILGAMNYTPKNNKVNDKFKENNVNRAVTRLTADGNINSVASAMKSIETILKAVFTDDRKVGFGETFNKGDFIVPFITYTTVSRERNHKTPMGPKRLDSPVKEIVNNEPTGDAFEISYNFYDCIIEFNIFANNTKEADYILDKFENCLETYKGSLKKAGISDIYFLKEISTKLSTLADQYPSKTLVYYMELQKFTCTRVSTLKNISIKIETSIEEDNPDLNNLLDEMSSENTLL